MAIAETPYKPNKKTLIAIAQVIKTLRNETGFTQEQLATKAGIHWRHIQRFETGKLNPSLCAFIDIAKGLNITASQLLEKIEKEV